MDLIWQNLSQTTAHLLTDPKAVSWVLNDSEPSSVVYNTEDNVFWPPLQSCLKAEMRK